MADTVGAGSEGFGVDGRLEHGGWGRGASGLRKEMGGLGQRSLLECRGSKVGKPGAGAGADGIRVEGGGNSGHKPPSTNAQKFMGAGLHVGGLKAPDVYETSQVPLPITKPIPEAVTTPAHTAGEYPRHSKSIPPSTPIPVNHYLDPPDPAPTSAQQPQAEAETEAEKEQEPNPTKPKPIFRNITIYINGSTYPLISDHKLKRLLVAHGANLSIALGRRTVTHVILGHANAISGPASGISSSASSGKTAGGVGVDKVAGAGGGLAASKIQKEIANVRGKGVKFVTAEWVVESVKCGRRLPEWQFGGVGCKMKRQGSVVGMLRRGRGRAEHDDG